jgi:hypothetical protein
MDHDMDHGWRAGGRAGRYIATQPYLSGGGAAVVYVRGGTSRFPSLPGALTDNYERAEVRK